MRIVVINQLTLDGVMQSPGRPGKDAAVSSATVAGRFGALRGVTDGPRLAPSPRLDGSVRSEPSDRQSPQGDATGWRPATPLCAGCYLRFTARLVVRFAAGFVVRFTARFVVRFADALAAVLGLGLTALFFTERPLFLGVGFAFTGTIVPPISGATTVGSTSLAPLGRTLSSASCWVRRTEGRAEETGLRFRRGPGVKDSSTHSASRELPHPRKTAERHSWREGVSRDGPAWTRTRDLPIMSRQL
jgi:hypothetical protein